MVSLKLLQRHLNRFYYDVTIKLYQYHMIKRVTSNACRGNVPDAINVLDVFCSCYAVISTVS